MNWETAIPWSTLLSWCLSFVSVPNRARPWRQTSLAGGWSSGEFKVHHEVQENGTFSSTVHQLPQSSSYCEASCGRWFDLSTFISLLWWNNWGEKSRAPSSKGKSFCCCLSAPAFPVTRASTFHSPSFLSSSSALASLSLACIED